jgi:hypothetical protein
MILCVTPRFGDDISRVCHEKPESMLRVRFITSSFEESRNHKYRPHGQRFQNRFKSILCQEDLHLMELAQFIHVKPLRAGLGEDTVFCQGSRLTHNSLPSIFHLTKTRGKEIP